MTAGELASFRVSFYDALDHRVHASELDVSVREAGSEARGRTTAGDRAVTGGLSAAPEEQMPQHMVVGAEALDVMEGEGLGGRWLGRVPPGRVLKVMNERLANLNNALTLTLTLALTLALTLTLALSLSLT